MGIEIRKGSLAAWLQTEEGLRHCALLRIDSSRGVRFTSPPTGTDADQQPADNIVMRPQQAAQGRIIELAERMILSHLREWHPVDTDVTRFSGHCR